jgi:hypothetical protein
MPAAFDPEQDRLVNVLVKGSGGEFIKSTDAQLVGARGKFELIGNGVFIVFFQNATFRATQFWVFNPDSTAMVKEVPDEGQRQMAVPVKGNSLEHPPAHK